MLWLWNCLSFIRQPAWQASVSSQCHRHRERHRDNFGQHRPIVCRLAGSHQRGRDWWVAYSEMCNIVPQATVQYWQDSTIVPQGPRILIAVRSGWHAWCWALSSLAVHQPHIEIAHRLGPVPYACTWYIVIYIYYIILYYIILYCTIVYYIILYYIILYYYIIFLLYYTILYYIILN